METQTEPVASYTLEDEYGEHEIEVQRATRVANRAITGLWRETNDVLVLELFRYIHGDRDHLPLDVWDGALRRAGGHLEVATIEDRGHIRSVTVLRDTDNGLQPDHQATLDQAMSSDHISVYVAAHDEATDLGWS